MWWQATILTVGAFVAGLSCSPPQPTATDLTATAIARPPPPRATADPTEVAISATRTAGRSAELASRTVLAAEATQRPPPTPLGPTGPQLTMTAIAVVAEATA